MGIPWIVLASSFVAPALPPIAAAIRRQPLDRARWWVLGWCLFVYAANLVSLFFALQNRNNHWLNYVVTPVAWGIVLWALSLWQSSSVAALSLRLMVPLLGITWIGIVIALENTQTFSLLAEPFAGLLVLGAAVYTLVSRAARERGDLLNQDWLWVALGLALASGAAVALPPTAHWLLTRRPELVVQAYKLKSLLEILALAAIARGVTCPIPVLNSGGPSSRASSPSPFSSSVSSSRS